jgi:hypothetical protein
MKKNTDQTRLDEELTKQRLDVELDRDLEATFPASDALKITQAIGRSFKVETHDE